jgi:hypothetical protein
MPVFIRTDHGHLRLILTSGGEVVDTQTAATPQEANRVAIMRIASRDAFDVGEHPDLPARWRRPRYGR